MLLKNEEKKKLNKETMKMDWPWLDLCTIDFGRRPPIFFDCGKINWFFKIIFVDKLKDVPALLFFFMKMLNFNSEAKKKRNETKRMYVRRQKRKSNSNRIVHTLLLIAYAHKQRKYFAFNSMEFNSFPFCADSSNAFFSSLIRFWSTLLVFLVQNRSYN